MVKSSTTKTNGKPAKPRRGFPLFPQATGRWAKKVCGKLEYVGPWSDPQAALNKWLDQKDDLLAGRRPRTRTAAATVAYLVDHFPTARQESLNAGELAERTFNRYYTTGALVVSAFGKNRAVDDLGTDDFQALRGIMAKRWGPVAVTGYKFRSRSCFDRQLRAMKANRRSGALAQPIERRP